MDAHIRIFLKGTLKNTKEHTRKQGQLEYLFMFSFQTFTISYIFKNQRQAYERGGLLVLKQVGLGSSQIDQGGSYMVS